MSPESTIEYYQYIVRTYTQRFGDHAYPEIIIYSVSFEQYIEWPAQGRWDLIAEGLSTAAKRLESAGTDFIIIATNTMHIVFDQVQASVNVPMINLLEVVGDAILKKGLNTVGLLGTRYTMEAEDLYPKALSKKGITVVIPDESGRDFVNRVIYDELIKGEIREESHRGFLKVILEMAERGAQGVILGCTEIPLLVKAEDTPLVLFDTTLLHAEAALGFALD
ncbi:MAG: amino acid racemase [candidate division Zixibacteria bacterium]|nr:amino acid racemase [Candidatus Tariuqbacter arcticus]